jgi:hypothetical protein
MPPVVTDETPLDSSAATLAPSTEVSPLQPETTTAQTEAAPASTTTAPATETEAVTETGSTEKTGECRRYIPAVGVTITVGC